MYVKTRKRLSRSISSPLPNAANNSLTRAIISPERDRESSSQILTGGALNQGKPRDTRFGVARKTNVSGTCGELGSRMRGDARSTAVNQGW